MKKRICAIRRWMMVLTLVMALGATALWANGGTPSDTPWILMSDARALPISAESAQRLASAAAGALKPLSLAAGDFNGDGASDLLTGYATAKGGLVTFQAGDPAGIGPEVVTARHGWPAGKLPFKDSVTQIPTEEVPNWILVGDFNADSHLDFAVAARGGSDIEVHLGDGKGGFSPASFVKLPGALTALAAGDVNRRDGLADWVAGIEGPESPALLVFESPEGAMRAKPERFVFDAPISALAVGCFSDGPFIDIVAAAGTKVAVIWGRDRKITHSEKIRQEVPNARMTSVTLSFETLDLAVGNFHWDPMHHISLAALGSDGRIRFLSPAPAGRSSAAGASSFGPWQSHPDIALPEKASRLCMARSTGLPVDGLLVLPQDPASPLRFIAGDVQDRTDDLAEVHRPPRSKTLSPQAVSTNATVVAALPLHLNEDALEDWILLGTDASGTAVTSAMTSQPEATYNVTNTNDSGAGSLRQAIINANNSVGSDTIDLEIPGTSAPTITLLSALPKITSVVTIQNLETYPWVGIDGTSAGSTANGLDVAGGNSAIWDLSIGSFGANGILLETNGGDTVAHCISGGNNNGIFINSTSTGDTIGGLDTSYRNQIVYNTLVGVRVNASSTIIEGNLIGNDGTKERPNGSYGIDVTGGSNTEIGGILSSARNILGGNVSGGVLLAGGSGTLVQGNWIGPNLAGDVEFSEGIVGVSITSGAAETIGGTSSGARNVINACSSYGIDVSTTGSVSIQGNYIGLTPAGTGILLPNVPQPDGIRVNASASPLIGGSAAGAGNAIGSNDMYGIEITGGAATISGNIIGLDGTGDDSTGDTGNGTAGIMIEAGSGTVIGGHTVNERNIISGNGSLTSTAPGIRIESTASNVGIYGNYIGPNKAGTASPTTNPNGYGIMSDTSSGLKIGDVTAGGGNLISSNMEDGIYLNGAPAVAPVICGNIIGLNADGTAVLENWGSGVHIVGGQNITLGGSSNGTGNVISGNTADGVTIESGSTNATGNALLGNKIGTDSTGTVAFGNSGAGVRVTGSGSSNNTIGLPPSGNTIANNSAGGVLIAGGTGNSIRGNSLYNNGGGSAAVLGIQLGSGLYSNTHCGGASGPNNLQNHPVITSVTPSGSGSLISGTLDSASLFTYTVDLYSNQTAHPSGYGEGRTWLGSVSVTTNLSCVASWSFTSSSPATNVSATATDPSGNTSEFAQTFIGNPTEAGPASSPLIASKGSGTAVNITYGAACNATGYAAYWGTSPISGSLSWQSDTCNVTTSFDPGAVASGKFVYFVVVGESGSNEGSYGKNSAGQELPAMSGGCHPQNLNGVCP